MKPIADLYLRVSTKSQAKGSGLLRQERACKEWCDRNGVEVRNIIKEVGSAYKSDSEGLGQQVLLEAAYNRWRKWYWEQKKEPLSEDECDPKVVAEACPQFLVCEAPDRFTRKKLEGVLFLLMLHSIGVEVVSATEIDLPILIENDKAYNVGKSKLTFPASGGFILSAREKK